MKIIYDDLIEFLKSLSILDILFFFSIFVLLILIVFLIYVIRINNENNDLDILDDNEEKRNDVDLDLVNISKLIEEEEPKPIILNNYEKEQEEKAIISYDELINSQQHSEVNYKKEEDIAGLKIKAVDTDNFTKPIELPKIKKEENYANDISSNQVILISYDKEEAFLETLKKLQKLLN